LRVLTICGAAFSFLVCAGSVVVLFILPTTSIPLWSNMGGDIHIAFRSWAMFVLLVFGLISGAAVLFGLRRSNALIGTHLVTVITVTAAAIAVVEFIAARYMDWLGSRDIPWLNITVVVSAALYWATRRQIGHNG
jgi:hypothetical protein